MGRLHAGMAAACGVKVVVCADVNRAAAEALAAQHGAEATTDAKKAIARKDVDIVCIATPTPYHLQYLKLAAKAKKHIFCEKPFCRTVAECREAIAIAKAEKVKVFVGHVVRYFHEFEAMRARVQAGKIGEAGYAKLYRGGIFPGGPKSWFADYAMSGGVTLDCMIHDLDWLRYVFGEPQRIFCQALMRGGAQPLDYSQVTLRMKSGLIAWVIGTWAHPAGFRVTAEICGSEGMIRYDSADAPLTSMARHSESGPSMIVPASPTVKSPYQLEWEEFLRWIKGGPAPRVSLQDALRAVEMAEAALESARTGQPVKL
jgi:predicted dehydrogenase